MERDTSLTPNSVYRWDASFPSVDKVMKVADYFGVSVDYLTGASGEKMPAARTGDGLTDAQRELMSLIPAMTPGEVSVLLATAKAQAAARTTRDDRR